MDDKSTDDLYAVYLGVAPGADRLGDKATGSFYTPYADRKAAEADIPRLRGLYPWATRPRAVLIVGRGFPGDDVRAPRLQHSWVLPDEPGDEDDEGDW